MPWGWHHVLAVHSHVGQDVYLQWWADMVDPTSILLLADTNSVARPEGRSRPRGEDVSYRAFLRAFDLQYLVDMHTVPAGTSTLLAHHHPPLLVVVTHPLVRDEKFHPDALARTPECRMSATLTPEDEADYRRTLHAFKPTHPGDQPIKWPRRLQGSVCPACSLYYDFSTFHHYSSPRSKGITIASLRDTEIVKNPEAVKSKAIQAEPENRNKNTTVCTARYKNLSVRRV